MIYWIIKNLIKIGQLASEMSKFKILDRLTDAEAQVRRAKMSKKSSVFTLFLIVGAI